MSDPNVGQLIASVWESVMTDGPVDNIFTAQQLIYLLNEEGFKEDSSGGRLFEATIEYALNTTFQGIGEFQTLDTTRIDTFDAARYDQKLFAGTVVFSELEELRNGVQGRKFDVVKAKVKNGINSCMEQLNTVLYADGTGHGGLDPDGLAKVISSTPTTGTVGGINRATFPFWRSRQASGAKTTNPFDNLRSVMTSVFNQCTLGGTERQPTGGITDRASFEGYEGLLVAVEKIEREARATGGDIAFLNDAIMFKGKPLMYDESCPAGLLYWVNNKYLKCYYLKGAWMQMFDPISPANQFTRVNRVLSVLNLATEASRHLGVVTAIT
jgi:hypothetical protein